MLVHSESGRLCQGDGRAFRVAVRVSRVFKAPRWFVRKGGLRLFRQAGLRGVIARTADKLAKKAA